MDPFEALIGGSNPEGAELKALSAALRKQNMMGMLAQASGDRVLSPLGSRMSTEAYGQAGALGKSRLAAEKLASDERQRQAMLEANESRFAAQQERFGMQQKGVQDRFDRTKAHQFSKTLASEGLTDTVYPMQNLMQYMSSVPEGDLKGVGMLATAEQDLTEQGRYVRTLFTALRNPILLARSGAAVTEAEDKRLLREFGMGTIQTEADFRKAVGLLAGTMGNTIGSLYGGIGGVDSAPAQYYIQGAGQGAITPDMFDFPTSEATTSPLAPSSSADIDAMQAELEQLNAQIGMM